ncbi:MAG: response regulator, partial [Candidatus Eiseniibacteriota bacterium]
MADLVMVIEDEKEIRDLVRYNLERAGFRVAAAADGEEGLQRLFSSRPDAVVLDLMLPGRNGLEVLKELRAEPTTRELPVIVLTARGAEMDKLLGFEHGADDYLTKPFSPRELVARLQALLRRARPEQGDTVIEA